MKTEHPLEVAARLEALGVHVQSVDLQAESEALRVFNERGGNRALLRAAKKQARSKR